MASLVPTVSVLLLTALQDLLLLQHLVQIVVWVNIFQQEDKHAQIAQPTLIAIQLQEIVSQNPALLQHQFHQRVQLV